MDLQRRFILKSMALASLAGLTLRRSGATLANAVMKAPSSPERLTVALVCDSARKSAFLEGVKTALPGITVPLAGADHSLDFVQSFNQLLHSSPSIRILGLVDDASAALIVPLARTAGSYLQWLGQHSVTAGRSHHSILSVESADGGGVHWARHLPTDGYKFRRSEPSMSRSRAPLERATAIPTRVGPTNENWSAILGFLLASLGASPLSTFPIPASTSPLFGPFVLFSIRT